MKITVGLGMTLPIIDYGNVRPEITIHELDLDGDVEAQLDAALAAAGTAFVKIDEHVSVVVSDLVGPGLGDKTSIVDRMASLETSASKSRETMNNVVRRLNEWRPIIEGLLPESSESQSDVVEGE